MNVDDVLAKFKIPRAVLESAGVRHVTDVEVRELLGVHGRIGQDLSGILFPYRHPREGNTLSYRVRLDVPLDGQQKYLSQQGCRILFFAPCQSEELTEVENLFVAGTVSCVVAKPKAGKSTFARNVVLAVARGENFLGLKTKQGECIYLALEEREEDIKNDFRAMGAILVSLRLTRHRRIKLHE